MKYGLIGEKLSHSYSKFIHENFYDIDYELVELDRNGVCDLLKNKDFICINVTIPYKEFVVKYLDELDEIASITGVVNVIINDNGILKGYNTDYYGFKQTILKENFKVKGTKCLIFGTGGTSKTIKKVLLDFGAKEIMFVSRTEKKGCITYQEASRKFETNFIFNATPYGMSPNIKEKTIIDLSSFPYLRGVGDVIFNPLHTSLIFDAKNRSIRTFNGLYMLVKQAELTHKLLNHKLKYNADEIYTKLLLKENNIIFIGMPCSGKTTAAINLAHKLNMRFIDTDKLIEEKEKKSINEIFKQKGEEYFRKLEFEVVEEISNRKGLIVSTGGGLILRKENVILLKQHGFFIFLNRPLEQLKEISMKINDRPLLKEKDIELIYNERLQIYYKYADMVINNRGSKNNTLKKILKGLNINEDKSN